MGRWRATPAFLAEVVSGRLLRGRRCRENSAEDGARLEILGIAALAQRLNRLSCKIRLLAKWPGRFAFSV